MPIFHKPFAYILFFISCALLIWGKMHHEMWIDEWHSITFSSQAQSLAELRSYQRCEGHPMLYFLSMYFLHLLTQNVNSLLLLHSVAAVVMFYFLFVKSPFNILVKIGFLLSIYFIWELPIIYRVYVIIMAILLAYVHLLSTKKISVISNCVFAMCLIHLNIYSLIVAVPLAVWYLYNNKNTLSNTQILGSIIFILLQVILSYLSIKTDADCLAQVNIQAINSNTLTSLMHGFNTGFLTRSFSIIPLAITSVITIIGLSVYTIQNNTLKLFYLATMAALVLICFLINAIGIRHLGYYFFTFIIYLWLDIKLQKPNYSFSLLSKMFIAFILFYQAKAGVTAYKKDILEPHSNSKNIAQYINTNYPSTMPVVGHSIWALEPIPPYLHRPLIGTHNMQPHMFCMLTQQQFGDALFTQENIKNNCVQLSKKYTRFLLVVNIEPNTQWLIDALQKNTTVQTIKIFDTPKGNQENYYLFEVSGELVF